MRIIFYFLFVILVITTSCKKESVLPDNSYDATQFVAHTSEAADITSRMILLADSMKKGKIAGVTLSAANLSSFYAFSLPSLQQATEPAFQVLVPALFQSLELASGNAFDPANSNLTGGLYGGYLFDQQGAEPGEIVDKGLYAALILHRIFSVYLQGEISLQDLDNALYLYGAHPDFSNSDKASYHTHPDILLAKYAARRDDGTGQGVYLQIKQHFIDAQHALKAGNAEQAKLQTAVAGLKNQMERAIAATIINYINASLSAFSQTSPTTETLASGMHAAGEAIGFSLGLKSLSGTQITDAELDAVLNALRYGSNPQQKVTDFVTDPVAAVAGLQPALGILQAAYGFSAAEMESFRFNQVNIREP